MNWNVWAPSPHAPWDMRRVVHLHQRAGFTPTWKERNRDLAGGLDQAIQNLLAPPADDQFETMATTIGEAAVGADNPDRLKAWWVHRMTRTSHPLLERMTLLWHNHFATSNKKVNDVAAMHEQNSAFRRGAFGRFGDMLKEVVKGPAMLVWLDAANNRKEHPNENLARELMELFTLGEGNYSEDDVAEAARCLTGWTVRDRRFVQVPQYHDSGSKTVLGHRQKLDGDQLVELLLRQPATAQRITDRLIGQFFGDGVVPPEAALQLANNLQHRDLDIGWAVETILRSNFFFSEQNLRCRVASPVEYVVGAVRALEMTSPPASTLLLARHLSEMGQDLFYPPTVFGWKEGKEWIHTRSLLARSDFANRLTSGRLYTSQTAWDPLELPRQHSFPGRPADFYQTLLSASARSGSHKADSELPATVESVRRAVATHLASHTFQIV